MAGPWRGPSPDVIRWRLAAKSRLRILRFCGLSSSVSFTRNQPFCPTLFVHSRTTRRAWWPENQPFILHRHILVSQAKSSRSLPSLLPTRFSFLVYFFFLPLLSISPLSMGASGVPRIWILSADQRFWTGPPETYYSTHPAHPRPTLFFLQFPHRFKHGRNSANPQQDPKRGLYVCMDVGCTHLRQVSVEEGGEGKELMREKLEAGGLIAHECRGSFATKSPDRLDHHYHGAQ
ncbi:hypothetical protein BD289DRAFT_177655 [Coniella lustricola]|uniref:Uncharacterized protein n=1 Tax=Coniella lustricola TaxID=2025994 RepID=A0A2T2ZTI1_9PEZI|nr:hypothetical protein BD289DRAFT_177655 [Coniella lustricola]